MKVLITGGAGFLGRRLAKRLLQKGALKNATSLQADASDLRTRFDMGDRSINLSDVMIAGQKSSIAFEATVQVRNKVVEAYKTIMNMPV